MKKSYLILVFSILAFAYACKKESSTPTTSGTTTTSVTKTPLDYEIEYGVKVNYSVTIIDGSTYSMGMGKSSTRISDAIVTITQGDRTIQARTGQEGMATFSGIYKGIIAVNITKDEYTTVNYLVTANGSVTDVNGTHIDMGNIISLFRVENNNLSANIKGRLTFQSDLTNNSRELVPQNTRVIASIDVNDTFFKNNYVNIKNPGLLGTLNTGKIIQYTYESFFYDSTDINGEYNIKVPGSLIGLPYRVTSSDLVADQKVFENSGVSGFNRTTSYRNIFSPDQAPSMVPLAGGAEVVFISGSGASALAGISGNGQVDRINISNGGSGYTAAPKVTITGGGGSGATAVAVVSAGIVTAINITSGGNGYTSEPSVSITSGSGGSISATLSNNGSVYSINLLNSGAGYTNTPNVTISAPSLPGGVTATASANLSNGRVTSISIINQGSGYTSAPSVVIDPAPAGGTNATASSVFSGFSIQSLNISNPGSGYTGNPTLIFTDPTLASGSKATAIAQVDVQTGQITGVTLTNPGSGYFSTPSISISSGSGAAGTAVFSGRSITGLTLTNGGSNYNVPPSVRITGGGGSGAQALATVSGGRITSLTITNPGSGYTSSPIVEFISGSGAQASISVLNGQISAINVVNGGSQYNGAPSVLINPLPSNGPGGGATATAVVNSSGTVTAVTITNPGNGYIGGNSPSIAEPYVIMPSLVNEHLYVKPAIVYYRDIHYGTGKKIQ